MSKFVERWRNMAKAGNTAEELALIKKILEQFPGGASLEQIKKASGLKLTERTMLRRFNRLEQKGVVKPTGNTSSRLYHLTGIVNPATQPAAIIPDLLPISNEGREILENVRRAKQQRKPVGYNRAFLENYIPNQTYYLTGEERKKLAAMGTTTQDESPAGTYVKVILQRLLIDLSWNSSRLEGNTYSLLDTERLIDTGEMAGNKSAIDAQMIINHKAAIEFLAQGHEGIGFNRYTLLNLHALLADNLLPDPSAVGRLRTIIVGIQNTVFTPLSIPQVLEEYFELLLEKAFSITDPFEQSFFAMVHLPYLQPYDDINKRVSRLAANIPFIQHNLAPLSFTDVPADLYFSGLLGIYELNRVELLKDLFLWAYERSAIQYTVVRQSIGEPDHFRLKYRKQIQELITAIVKETHPPAQTTVKIATTATSIPPEDREQFATTIEKELMALHEGNIARYYIRPQEFQAWISAGKS